MRALALVEKELQHLQLLRQQGNRLHLRDALHAVVDAA